MRILLILLIITSGCRTDDEKIRQAVREELSSATARKAITDSKTIGPYSPAQVVGNFVFVSGQIALDQESGMLRNADIQEETRQSLDNVMKILHDAGADSADVLATTVYLRDMGDYARMNVIYGGYFQDGNYPARTTVQVSALPKDARVEISAIAYKKQTQ